MNQQKEKNWSSAGEGDVCCYIHLSIHRGKKGVVNFIHFSEERGGEENGGRGKNS